MGGGGGDQRTEVRYAPYLESAHQTFLNLVSTKRAEVIDSSPYSTFTAFDIDDGFLGTGYALANFPSLYDMFGKFMAGLDIEVLFDQQFYDTLSSPYIDSLVSEEGVRLEDDLNEIAIPSFTTGMRDINSVISSSFVIGKSLLEVNRQKQLSRFSAELRYKLIPLISG